MSLIKAAAAKIFRQTAKFMKGNQCQLVRPLHHSVYEHESDEDLDARYICYFARDDLDGWDVRQGMNDVLGHDMVPDPEIIKSAMYACRRINDFAVAIRFLEAVKNKCGDHVDKVYPYILQEIQPTLCQLGIETVEEMGFDKPELFVDDVHEM